MIPPERKVKMVLEYDGTAYHGWQVQPNGRTVQECVEEVLARLTGTRCRVVGAGRTDAGVHAEAQVAHCRLRTRLSAVELHRGLNALLPDDVVVHAVEEAPPGFHARRSALDKSYRYVILNRGHASALHRNRCWHVRRPLDTAAMERAASYLPGRRDFSCFRAADCCAGNAVREVRELSVERRGEWITVRVRADAFLKHMVRNIVGTLVEVGRGKMAPEEMADLLASRDRRRAGPTAPACGLFLERVRYPAGM